MALRMKIACVKHPRYNPEDGEAAIRGACKFCQELFKLYLYAVKVTRQEWESLHTETDEEIGGL